MSDKPVYCLDCGKLISLRAIRCQSCAHKLLSKGELNPNWKGGIHYYRGYVWVYNPEHPYRQYNGDVKRSRLVMEGYIGRYLLPCEYIHHKDGDKLNDKIGNLEILTNGKHIALHNRIIGCRNKYRDGKGRFARKENVCV